MTNLRKFRKRERFTLKELADLAGVSESAIGMIETGKRNPSFEVLLRLSEALGCTVDELVRDENEKSPSEEDELMEELQMLRDLPERRALLHATRDLTADQVRQMADFLEGMKRQSGNDY